MIKILTEQEYNDLQKRHEEGCRNNDYSKMIMMGDENDLAMKKYIRENNLCSHPYVDVQQGGQYERCTKCGKEWG